MRSRDHPRKKPPHADSQGFQPLQMSTSTAKVEAAHTTAKRTTRPRAAAAQGALRKALGFSVTSGSQQPGHSQ